MPNLPNKGADPAYIVVSEATAYQAENQRLKIEQDLLAREVKGREGYRVFDTPVGKGESQVIERTTVFNAEDGHMVIVVDPGDWSYDYVFNEILPNSLGVQASVRKKFGNNYREIDRKIDVLVRSLIRPKTATDNEFSNRP